MSSKVLSYWYSMTRLAAPWMQLCVPMTPALGVGDRNVNPRGILTSCSSWNLEFQVQKETTVSTPWWAAARREIAFGLHTLASKSTHILPHTEKKKWNKRRKNGRTEGEGEIAGGNLELITQHSLCTETSVFLQTKLIQECDPFCHLRYTEFPKCPLHLKSVPLFFLTSFFFLHV